jgi:hypothetical protein
MKATYLFTFLSIILFSCNSKPIETAGVESTMPKDSVQIVKKQKPKIKLDYQLLFDSIICNPIAGKEQLSYKFNIDSTNDFLKSIIVYADFKEMQKINVNQRVEGNKFQLIDWNFDGYKDISVLSNSGSGGSTYFIWNYIPKSSKYVYNKDLSENLGLEIDSISKYIIFHYRAGYPEEKWDTFSYVNNKLHFLKGVYQERFSDGKNDWVKRSRSIILNNKLIETVDSFIVKH